MKKNLIATAVAGVLLAGGAGRASAAPQTSFHGHNGAAVKSQVLRVHDDGRGWHGRRHHRLHKVCVWRHHKKVCLWR